MTNGNKREYIERVANYLLVKRIKVQADAFRRGLAEIIDLNWLQMFNEPELQVCSGVQWCSFGLVWARLWDARRPEAFRSFRSFRSFRLIQGLGTFGFHMDHSWDLGPSICLHSFLHIV